MLIVCLIRIHAKHAFDSMLDEYLIIKTSFAGISHIKPFCSHVNEDTSVCIYVFFYIFRITYYKCISGVSRPASIPHVYLMVYE